MVAWVSCAYVVLTVLYQVHHYTVSCSPALIAPSLLRYYANGVRQIQHQRQHSSPAGFERDISLAHPPPMPGTTSSSSSSSVGTPPPLILGACTAAVPSVTDVQTLHTINATHARLYLHWRYIEGTIANATIDRTLSVAKLQADPSLIYQWSASSAVNWRTHDDAVKSLYDNNIGIIGEIGEGTIEGLPVISGQAEDPTVTTSFDPNVVGLETYLAYIYRYSRAVVHRFKDRIFIWQLENELNEAFLAMLGGQRYFDLKVANDDAAVLPPSIISDPSSNAWGNFTFLSQLLSTLKGAVRDEESFLSSQSRSASDSLSSPSIAAAAAPTASSLLVNLHSDVSQQIHQEVRVPGFYLDAAKAWVAVADMITVDAYPNYFGALPLRTSVLGDRMKALKSVLPFNYPIGVMETGYPTLSTAALALNVPAQMNFTEANQAAFATDAVDQVLSNGGTIFLYFKVVPDSGIPAIPSGGYIAADDAMLTALSEFYVTQDPAIVFKYLNETGSLTELLTRLQYFTDYSHAWGALRPNGSARPVVASLAQAFKEAYLQHERRREGGTEGRREGGALLN